MQPPNSYPFVDYATWIAGVGPSISADFLLRTQRGMGDLYGAHIGRSGTEENDEYIDIVYPAGKLGALSVLTNTNPPGTMAVGPWPVLAQGEHGAAQVLANAAAAFTFLADGARSHLGLFDWVYSAKVRVVDRTRLDVIGNRGFQVGLFDQVEGTGTSARFLAGNDQANWQALIGATLVNTGVPFVAGAFIDLQMARISGTVTAYVNGALVATVAHNLNMSNCRRRIGTTSPGGNVADGFVLDYFRAWFQR